MFGKNVFLLLLNVFFIELKLNCINILSISYW